MAQQIYRYDLSKLVRRLMPPRIRSPFNLNWYETLLSGINYSQDRFNDFKDQSLVELSYNGQTIYLEKMLNDRFDYTLRRISIIHEESNDVYWFNESELQAPSYLYNESESGITSGYSNTYIHNEGENTSTLPDVDFMVKAPLSLSSMEVRMRSEIDKYRLGGKIYQIIFS